jgi:carbonic anhydrase/acetyltransferase-like protein (isoleucine patch superfamily)
MGRPERELKPSPIEVGFGTNIQDGVTVHVDSEYPVSIGSGVRVGHNASCTGARSTTTR